MRLKPLGSGKSDEIIAADDDAGTKNKIIKDIQDSVITMGNKEDDKRNK